MYRTPSTMTPGPMESIDLDEGSTTSGTSMMLDMERTDRTDRSNKVVYGQVKKSEESEDSMDSDRESGSSTSGSTESDEYATHSHKHSRNGSFAGAIVFKNSLSVREDREMETNGLSSVTAGTVPDSPR